MFLGKQQQKKEIRKRKEGRKERISRKDRQKESQRKKGQGKTGKQTLDFFVVFFSIFVCYWAKNNPTFLSQKAENRDFKILKKPIL